MFSIWTEFLNWDKNKIKSDLGYKNYLTNIIDNTDIVFMPHPNEAPAEILTKLATKLVPFQLILLKLERLLVSKI